MKMSVFFDHILQAKQQTGKSLEELLQGVRQAGIEAVEINLDYLLKEEWVWEALKQADLKISCIYEFYEMGQQDESGMCQKHIETAVSVGADRVLVVPGFLHGLEFKRMQFCMPRKKAIEYFMNHNRKIQRMKEQLSVMAKLGQEQGVVVTVEDFDDPHSPLSGVHGIHWFLQQIPQLGYTLDTGNYLYYGEELSEVIALLGNRIAHVHCKDRHAGDNASVAVGTGYIPFEKVLAGLKELNYAGYLAIEHFDVPDQDGSMRSSAEMLRKWI